MKHLLKYTCYLLLLSPMYTISVTEYAEMSYGAKLHHVERILTKHDIYRDAENMLYELDLRAYPIANRDNRALSTLIFEIITEEQWDFPASKRPDLRLKLKLKYNPWKPVCPKFLEGK